MEVDVAANPIKLRVFLCFVALFSNIDKTALTVQAYVDGIVSSGYSDHADIGPVEKLSYRIVNVTALTATWNRPVTKEEITGYTLECTNLGRQSSRKTDVSTASEIVQASLELQYQVESFECEVWAFSKDQNGTTVSFNITTLGLHPVANLSFVAGCDGSLQATWSYTHQNEAGFNLTICWLSGTKCDSTIVKKNVRLYSFLAKDLDVQYRLHVSAIGKISGLNVHSEEVTANATSFPQVPLLADVVVNGVSPETLKATWQSNWTHEIHFAICWFGPSNQHCQNYNVSGALHQATFTGLLPETTYDVKSNGQVTYGNRTCIGPQTEQAASTYSLNPGPVRDLRYEIDNVTILAANWDGPLASVDYDGYVLHCVENDFRAVRTIEIPEAEKHVNISLDLEEQVATFDCKVWAFAYNGTQRNNGTITTFSVTTNGIGPPENVTLIERTTMSLAYSWPRDPKAPNCHVRVLAAYVSEEYENDCPRLSDKDVIQYNVTNLTPGQRYNISIQNCADYCGLDKVVNDYTDVAAPSEVGNFSASVTDFVKVTFKWEQPAQPNGPIDGYLIQVVNEDSNITTQILADGVTTNVTLDVGSQFTYFHCAINAYNVRKPEQEKLFGPGISTTFESLGNGPFPPYPTTRDIEETDAAVYWEKAEDPRYNITSYRISLEGKGSFPTTDTKFNLSNLHPWTKYVVGVSSCAQETGCGQARSTSFRTDVSAPSKPLWLTTESVGAEWIYFEWERPEVPNGPIDGFNVSVVGRNVSFGAVTTDLSYNATQLSPGMLYIVSVFAFNYGFQKEKRGPSATLRASTSSDAISTTSLWLIIGVVSFFVTICAVAVYFLWQQFRTDIRRTPSMEDEAELHAMKPWLRIRRKLCPMGVFGQDELDDRLFS
ncbi:receptor-type tyrosine-protein phosphatase H-like isoform X2 [Dermacentor albipictus]|uniref:receptor-type tyrosine-protein phosphatase H-like isoform X2 n=1 Tax=Dermacentor albipictus TaxID=60249 RepID=UPI0038FD1995